MNGVTIVSGSQDLTLRLWNSFTGRLIRTESGFRSPVWDVDVSSAGDLAIGSNQMVGLWRGTDGMFDDTSLHPGIGTPLAGQSEQENTYLAAYSSSQIRLKRPYTWRHNCGDGVVDEGELLDNGQPWTGGEFTASCGATCCDGIVQNGEDCDDGNDSNDDACLNTCQPHRCGDGIVARTFSRVKQVMSPVTMRTMIGSMVVD